MRGSGARVPAPRIGLTPVHQTLGPDNERSPPFLRNDGDLSCLSHGVSDGT